MLYSNSEWCRSRVSGETRIANGDLGAQKCTDIRAIDAENLYKDISGFFYE